MYSVINTFYDAVIVMNNMQYMHWNAIGNKFDRLHLLCEEYYKKLADDVDFLAELAIERNETIKNSSMASNESKIAVESKKAYTWEDAIFAIYKNLQAYIQSLYNLRNDNNIPNDVKSELDTMIRFWSKENNYKNNRRMKEI